MLGNYFYHEIIKKTVIAFGTLFNDIHVRHEDGAGNIISDIKVPVAYGPRQKFLARVTQQAELNKATQITCLLYTSPSPRDRTRSRMPSSA